MSDKNQQTVNLEDLVKHVTEQVTNRLGVDIQAKLDIAIDQLNTKRENTKDRLVLKGKDEYSLEADVDGFIITHKTKPALIVGKNGQLGTGTRTPRTVGRGSAHFKMGNSEAVMPTSGKHSTRGLIVESDGDDDQTFVFRAVSKVNRQGVNVFGDGAVGVKSITRVNNSSLGVYEKESDSNVIGIDVATKDYQSDILQATVNAPKSSNWNAISISADAGEDGIGEEIFKVDGRGRTFSDSSYYSNFNGYAEMFEWADGNHRDEDRNGLAVSLDDNGKLVVANEGDQVIGVIVPHASMIGNAMWNNWHKKYNANVNGVRRTDKYSIIEWTEDETSSLKSFYANSLSDNFATPSNAIELQTDENGIEFTKDRIHTAFDTEKCYVGRQDRQEWAIVCLVGTVPVFKGQVINPNWISVKDLTDELELMIVK